VRIAGQIERIGMKELKTLATSTGRLTSATSPDCAKTERLKDKIASMRERWMS